MQMQMQLQLQAASFRVVTGNWQLANWQHLALAIKANAAHAYSVP